MSRISTNEIERIKATLSETQKVLAFANTTMAKAVEQLNRNGVATPSVAPHGLTPCVYLNKDGGRHYTAEACAAKGLSIPDDAFKVTIYQAAAVAMGKPMHEILNP